MVGLSEVTNWPKSVRRPKKDITKKKLNIHVISDGITRLPILEGEISQIELPLCDRKVLGMTIVGGSDTPLRCIVIQEVFHDGLITQDGRLQPGDQIVEVDGKDMTNASHEEVYEALKRDLVMLKLGIYREKIEYCSASPSSVILGHNFDRKYFATQHNSSSIIQPYHTSKREFQIIKLRKNCNQKTGIVLRKNHSTNEFHIGEIIPNSAADSEAKLDINDCLICVNGEDIRHYDINIVNDLLEKLEHEVHLVVKKDRNISSPVDYKLNTLDDSDRKTWSTGSISDRISELSCVDDQATFSDDISEHSRSSYDTKSVSDINTQPDSGIFCYLKGCEDESYQINEHCSISECIKKQPYNSTIYSSSIKQNKSVESLTNVFFRRKSSQKKVEPKRVVLRKKEGEGLGMRIGGGLNSNEGDTPIYVANINVNGPAGRSHQIKKGDIVLSVNENLLVGLTHSQAVSYLKLTSNLSTVSLTTFGGPETLKGTDNFVPSWLFWQKLPKNLHISKSIVLHRAPGASLGFSIVGGNDSLRGPEPIYVLFVVAASPAAIEGKLRSGDKLLAVDGQSLESVPHAVAVSMLKHAGNRVHLEIVSWLGTEI